LAICAVAAGLDGNVLYLLSSSSSSFSLKFSFFNVASVVVLNDNCTMKCVSHK